MLKETIKYTDFNDVEQTETLYFNLTKTDLTELLDLLPRLEDWSARVSGDARELTMRETQDMLDILKELIQHSYGIRSEDGKKFRKSAEIWADFKDSAAYDAFVFGMFENVERAVNFMIGIVPKGMLDDAVKAQALQSVEVQNGTVTSVEDVPLPTEPQELSATQAEVPAWVREDRAPTQKELTSMGREEMLLAFQRKVQK